MSPVQPSSNRQPSEEVLGHMRTYILLLAMAEKLHKIARQLQAWRELHIEVAPRRLCMEALCDGKEVLQILEAGAFRKNPERGRYVADDNFANELFDMYLESGKAVHAATLLADGSWEQSEQGALGKLVAIVDLLTGQWRSESKPFFWEAAKFLRGCGESVAARVQALCEDKITKCVQSWGSCASRHPAGPTRDTLWLVLRLHCLASARTSTHTIASDPVVMSFHSLLTKSKYGYDFPGHSDLFREVDNQYFWEYLVGLFHNDAEVVARRALPQGPDWRPHLEDLVGQHVQKKPAVALPLLEDEPRLRRAFEGHLSQYLKAGGTSSDLHQVLKKYPWLADESDELRKNKELRQAIPGQRS
ncbi:unnamed protein product [Symbiodinium natans]|uniref:Uncharacterized protein n=1 Tax=Symbiodinium natans TaxID=878477 RepID=A0A812VA99_9DINO|nr:unnamed protein product [Symbiodinium natans]